MPEIKWDLTPIARKMIRDSAQRAARLLKAHGVQVDALTIEMDLTATHLNGCPLNLAKLRDFPDTDFLHDITGINRYLDQKTGQLTSCFVPRCAQTEADRAAAQQRVLDAIYRPTTESQV